MSRKTQFISVLLAIFCFALPAIAQETTGIIEITTRDSTGAVVPGVTIVVQNESGTAGFRRTITTNENGFQRIIQVPPGVYTARAEATGGFDGKTFTNITVVLGRSTPVDLDLSVGGVDAVVDVTAGDNATISVTDSRIQTNITSETAELLPKGTNFASLLKVSPSTRPESKSGGYQVDGASGSENTFIVDGNEVTNAISGTLDTNNNLPFSLIQEVQVKSSGFEAEYSGATGGVINVVTKGGGNDINGEFGLSFSPAKLQAANRDVLYLQGTEPVHLRYNGLGDTTRFLPTASLGGPIIKDRVWFLTSYSPQISETTRRIPYQTIDHVTYRASTRSDYAFGRIDAQPFDRLRLTGKFIWNPYATQGAIPSLTSQFGDSLPQGNGLEGTEYTDTRGGRQNSNMVTVGGVWNPTDSVIVSARYGRNFINSKLGTYGLPAPFPYTPSNSRIGCSTASMQPPAGSGCSQPGIYNGIAWAGSTVYDATVRETIDADATFIFEAGGLHELKGGYQRNEINNDVLSPRNAYILLYYGWDIDAISGRTVTPTAGAIGAGRVITFGAQGSAASTNDGIFVQDKWQPTDRLTLNLGFRMEQENVPSFNEFPAIDFGWGDKIAPRIGVAYDLTGDGKTKLSGFFGWFYDRFKYELPRGSFGGNIYYSNWFEIFDANKDYRTYDPGAILGGGQQIVVGGNCPQTGFAYADVRCSVDHRVPSNDPSLDIAEQGGIDPNILAMRQTELSFTFEREIADMYKFSVRYVHKNLDRAVEDAGFITASGSEAYIIGNPGLGLIKEFYEQNGWTPVTAKREYDALEIGLNRRFSDNYYFNVNYTYSRLWGNYSGLASSDEEGRTDPNVSRAFDAPFTEASVSGGETVGLLATDRPHSIKFQGAYNVDWGKMFDMPNNSTTLKGFVTAQSGTPITTFVKVAGYDNIILNQRGDLGRTEFYSSVDLGISHRYKFGRDNRFSFIADLDLLNALNQNNVTNLYNNSDNTNYSLDDPANGLVTVAEAASLSSGDLISLAEQRFQQNGAPVIYSHIQSSTAIDPRFKSANGFQSPRSVRFGFRFVF